MLTHSGAGRVAHIPIVMTVIPKAPICAASGIRISFCAPSAGRTEEGVQNSTGRAEVLC